VQGITEPVNDVTLSFEIDGKIAKVLFKEGQNVAKRSTLIELHKWLERFESQRFELIWKDKSEVQAASEREKTLKSLYESTLDLYEQTGSVSKDEIDKLELEYTMAALEHQRLETAENREQIEYDMALARLDKLSLRSPINGIVAELYLVEGESCESRQPVVRVVDVSQCLLVCNIEYFIGANLKEGQTVELSIPVGAGTVEKIGTIIFISPVADPASGLLTVKAKFKNSDRKVKPGVIGSMLLPD
ncbi:MAG: efflux RND transporter periplasmic adaptor subunit, partial [Deltaproteobacteria bacterium]|nr:efflux RND transporter periplasmic adaptor subunit [Deltaproteobacteria bacterium]